MITVKARDTHVVRWQANMDLSAASVRLIAKRPGCTPVILASEIEDPETGIVKHTLTGTLAVGVYDIELEVTVTGEVVTFPNDGYSQLAVRTDLA